jgi:hypothetical protein
MSVKAAKLRATLNKTLSFFLVTFGVCSVSIEAFGYPLNSSVDSVTITRSARETPKAQKAVESSPPKSPFAPGTHNLSIGVGQDFLFGHLGNDYDNAIGPEIHYAYGVSDLFAFESNFGYQNHSRAGQNLSVWNIAAGLRSNLMYFDQLVPYFNLDLGFYHPSFTYVNNGSASTTLFGLQMGTGIDLLITNTVFFGAALTFNDMFDSTKTDSNGKEQSLGGSYVSFMVHAGVTF